MKHLFIAIAIGCQKPAPPEASADLTAIVAASPASPISIDRMASAPSDGVLVELIEPGEGEGVALRFAPEFARTETARMTMGMTMSMTMAGLEIPPVVTPPIIFDMALSVDSMAPDGNVTYLAEVVRVEVGESTRSPPGLAEQLEASVGGMLGLAGTVVMTPTGRTLEAIFEAPPGASEEIQQYVDSAEQSASTLCSPLPDEPVAPGARWIVLSRMNSNGIELVQQQTVDYISRDGDTLTLKVAIVQAYTGAEVVFPDLPPGTEIEITHFEGGGDGITTFRLDGLVPLRSHVESAVAMALRVRADGISQEISTAMDITLDIERQ